MQVYTKDGIVFARAESITDIKSLLALCSPTTSKEKVITTKSPKKSYKKQYMKTCEDCGKKCKGNIGLGNHKCVKPKEESNFDGPYITNPVAHQIPITTS